MVRKYQQLLVGVLQQLLQVLLHRLHLHRWHDSRQILIQSRCRRSAFCILCSASSLFICKILGCYSVCVVGWAKYMRGQMSGAILCRLGLLGHTVRGLIDCTLMVAFFV